MKNIILFILLCLGSCWYVFAQVNLESAPSPSPVQSILFNIFVILATAFVIVLVYSLRSNKNQFEFLCWVKTNYFRFILGAVLGAIISILVVVSPDIDALFTIIGFNASRTPISIGLALGAFLIAGVSGGKTENK